MPSHLAKDSIAQHLYASKDQKKMPIGGVWSNALEQQLEQLPCHGKLRTGILRHR
jgi:hypothetical protein